MSAYATVSDVEARLTRTLSSDEEAVCTALLDDAAVIIDAVARKAAADAKRTVSCNMVIRALGSGGDSGVPAGATQGTVSALGYSQTWTIGSGGTTGELYLSRLDKLLLGRANAIGASNPLAALVPEVSAP